MIDKVTRAILFAQVAHKDQLDDDGKDYFTAHLNKVGHAVQMLTTDEDIICAAYLHDVLEDTFTTYDEVLGEFGLRVADLVYECTDEGEADSYGKYFPRLKSADAILIKLIDRASNISRMQSWPENRKKQYLKRTQFWKDGSDIVNNANNTRNPGKKEVS